MESTEETLADIERAQLAAYEASAEDPLWIWPVIGLLVFAFLASWSFDPVAIPIVVTIAYAVGIGALIGVMTKRRGVQPPTNIREMPPSLRRELYIFWALCTVGAMGIALAQAAVGWVGAGIIAGGGITVAGVIYHQRYRSRVAELASAT